ncbi:MAG TPA: transporter substrate-binding domain-containing protein [Myxococcota bacterium]|nr:transporter substrate-binding domain-containing protein [Myxococcota bacterium]
MRGLRSAWPGAACVFFAGAFAALSWAGETSSAPPLRIGTSGDYAPFSFDSDTTAEGIDGFDVVLARAFAEAEGRSLELVRFRWSELEAALREGRFDIAMSGVTVRADRSLVGRFSLPVAEGGAVALVRDPERFPDLAALERGHPRIVVNAGGHLERIARERFPNAQLEALPDNAQVRRTLLEGRADAAVSDTFEAPEWRRGAGPLVALGPFSHDRKAPLVRADLTELADHLDLWLFAREADGTLSELRRTWFADPHPAPTATPLAALLAAADERLALMPLVAEAKRRAGWPIRDEAQEARVLDAAVRAVHEEAARAGIRQRSEAAIRGVFQALIAAARDLERGVLEAPQDERIGELPSLDAALRPAIARITPKIARALVRLDALPPADALRRMVREELRAANVGEEDARRFAEALSAYGAESTPPRSAAQPAAR